jgi:hypothetical protein
LLVFALAVASLFLVANRGAYRGFFPDDDLDNLAQGRQADLLYYGKMLLSPKFGGDTNFRPAAGFYYWAAPRLFGLRFKPYIGTIHAIHLLNVLLVWLVARSLKASLAGACAAALLFAFHMGAFLIYWAPMYVFDLMCATFMLLAVLTYINQRLFLSVVFFWLALKSKESVILLPLVLAAYEYWFGDRRWRRLIPFFTMALVIGVEALVFNAHRDNAYSFRFGPAALWTTVRFYSQKLTLLPLAYALGVCAALVATPLNTSNRMVRFGVFTFVAMLAPMLLLPGRLFGAYIYVAVAGLAIAISAVSRPVWLIAFFVLWIPWNYRQMRIDRNVELAQADDRRAWFQPVAEFVRSHPEATTFVYSGAPETMAPHGIAGALSALHAPGTTIKAIWEGVPDRQELQAALAVPDVVVIAWDVHKSIVMPRVPDVAYVRSNHAAPLWQLGDGWIDEGYRFRWIEPHATARLATLPAAKSFELVVNVAPIYIEQLHEGRIEVSLNHRHVGFALMREAVQTTYRFPVPEDLTSPVEVEFQVAPPLKDPAGSTKLYGAPIAAFGFVK